VKHLAGNEGVSVGALILYLKKSSSIKNEGGNVCDVEKRAQSEKRIWDSPTEQQEGDDPGKGFKVKDGQDLNENSSFGGNTSDS